jgi:hypothetical protein
VTPIPEPLTAQEQQQIILPDQPWDDRRALLTVQRDFNTAESWRMQNYDRSLRRNDDIYYAVTKVNTWDGTRIPRASIPDLDGECGTFRRSTLT